MSIPVYEIEILINSFCKPVYYSLGDKLASGKIINERNQFYNIKSWKIILKATQDEMREANKQLLKKFYIIEKITAYQTKYFGDDFSNKLLTIFVKDSKKVYLFTTYELASLTKMYPSEFNKLYDEYISPVLYKAGEIGTLADYVVTDNPESTIIKELNLRLTKKIDLKR